ncbi:MAG: polymer-forming cytoskeletal protein [Oculatellaceae cyanobacterium Prado106]|jgi:cytoskeletal protein CcmA (bactofilin family)|nr:polymer-forming cytoskeletal protein [Oculatellaceae cyanobacterium Prado106]
MFWRTQKATPSALTYLSPTTELQGNLNVEGNLRVDGIIHGNVLVQGDLELSQSGLIEGAELKGHNIIVHGLVKARITATGRLTLSKTARLEGDVTAQSLDIEAGAFYTGHISTAEDEVRSLPLSGKYPELVGREEGLQT